MLLLVVIVDPVGLFALIWLVGGRGSSLEFIPVLLVTLGTSLLGTFTLSIAAGGPPIFLSEMSAPAWAASLGVLAALSLLLVKACRMSVVRSLVVSMLYGIFRILSPIALLSLFWKH